MVIQVIVSTYEGQKITVDLCQDEKQLQLTTVLQLKQKIALKLPGKAGMGHFLKMSVCRPSFFFFFFFF
uniref:Ubiquitin-like domain-containing protein n=2 Tax=Oryzias sinensis TaxID=183150 RepID=A0A8C7Y6D0_9TELE